MKNSKLRRALLLLACAVMLVSLSVGATLAYLTSQTTEVKNTFTVGAVNITLDEALVDLYGNPLKEVKTTAEDGSEKITYEKVTDPTTAKRVMTNEYKLLPGHTYTKDPTVYVEAGSERCYLFVKIKDDLTAIQDTATIASQMDALGWKQLVVDGVNVAGVYYYNQVVDAREATDPVAVKVFEYFKIKGDAEVADYVTNADKTDNIVTINAYAIQEDGFADAAAAWKAAPASWN